MVTEKERIRNIAMLERVDELRIAAGMSKAEMYDGSGITQGAVSQWRTGLSNPSARSVRALAAFFGTTEEFLLYGKEQPTATGGLTQAQRELIDLIPQMSEGEVAVLLATAKAQEAIRRNQGGRE